MNSHSKKWNATFVDNDADFEALCQKLLSTATHLALDTEFERETTYYSKWCLLQLASQGEVYFVDPLCINNWQSFVEILQAPHIEKILHAAFQDLEIFWHQWQLVPQALMDTQLAALFLGMNEQIGYGNLVEQLLDIKLPKQHSRSNWSRRPLSPEQLDYAAEDVYYLEKCYLLMKQGLIDNGNREWFEQEQQHYLQQLSFDLPPEQAWQKVSGNQLLKNHELGPLQQLAAWREQEAIKRNQNRRRILADKAMITLVRKNPRSFAALHKISDLPAHMVQQHGQQWLELLEQGKETPSLDRPSKSTKLDEAQQATADIVKAIVHSRARQHQLNASLLLNGKAIETALFDETKQTMPGWRAEFMGDLLERARSGRIDLRLENGVITLLNE